MRSPKRLTSVGLDLEVPSSACPRPRCRSTAGRAACGSRRPRSAARRSPRARRATLPISWSETSPRVTTPIALADQAAADDQRVGLLAGTCSAASSCGAQVVGLGLGLAHVAAQRRAHVAARPRRPGRGRRSPRPAAARGRARGRPRRARGRDSGSRTSASGLRVDAQQDLQLQPQQVGDVAQPGRERHDGDEARSRRRRTERRSGRSPGRGRYRRRTPLASTRISPIRRRVRNVDDMPAAVLVQELDEVELRADGDDRAARPSRRR